MSTSYGAYDMDDPKYSAKITALIESILLDPKNLLTPVELRQQSNAAIRAIRQVDVNDDKVISLEEVKPLFEALGK